MSTSSVATIFATLNNSVIDILTDNLGLILVTVGALIGLGLLVRVVKRHIGRKI